MRPDRAIAMLDRQLASHGSKVVFARQGAPQHEARAFVRGYTSEELVGLIEQADRKLVVSPTSLAGFMPKKKDRVTASGKSGTVEDVDPVEIDGVVVRFNIRVRLAA
ncbi:hypothetical protein AKG11_03580 [Shinella sp. SUS2]|uniref:hypothetical protein n=1 Tax=unclassified Shinella TaxID=2643062 RepID=UPI00068374A7|nr:MULTISPECIES: hypothetical protein [unclassified Shinella]KNY18227.1 hypothetical protein AKG11_03580 [Shinella sp. SUS2]KOC77422.1 hypothetical protein AKG10_01050 [Shinella sp. GWS1]